MSPIEPVTYGGKGAKSVKHQAVKRVYAHNPVGCLLSGLAILILALALIGMDLNCNGCIGGDACSDYWQAGATLSSYERTAWVAGEILHTQLTSIAATEAAHPQP